MSQSITFMKNEETKYTMGGAITRISDSEILESLKRYHIKKQNRPFTTLEFDSWSDKVCTSSTVSKRFGSWRAALAKLGITKGVQAREYSAVELIENLKRVWDELGRRPGKRALSKHGYGISERPYINRWGSFEKACKAFVDFCNGEITEEQLLSGEEPSNTRRTIPLKDRWVILKRDHYRCVKCGSKPPEVELEIDHILPVSKGGSNDLNNLQTLCNLCNQGKKDRVE